MKFRETLPLLAVVLLASTCVEGKVIPSTDREGTGSTEPLSDVTAVLSSAFDTTKCAKCEDGKEYERASNGYIISCKCVVPEFFHYDMKLAERTRPIVMSLAGKGNGLHRGLTGDSSLYWPKSSDDTVQIPYVIENNFRHRETFQAAIRSFNEKTCIRFIPRTSQSDYITIADLQGCWAYVGRVRGTQEVSLGQGCGNLGVIQHELMHVLGFFHEQSRPDRDSYVKIHTENIYPDFTSNFDKMANIDSLGSPYDIGSVMHYGEYAFSINNEPTISVLRNPNNLLVGQREGFSDIDVQQINMRYCPSYIINPVEETTTPVNKPTTPVTEPTTPVTEPTTTPVEVCRDLASEKDCAFWKSQLYCQYEHVSFMAQYCTATCELCGGTTKPPTTTTTPITTTACKNTQKDTDCEFWKGEGYCTGGEHKAFMERHCKRSCGLCV